MHIHTPFEAPLPIVFLYVQSTFKKFSSSMHYHIPSFYEYLTHLYLLVGTCHPTLLDDFMPSLVVPHTKLCPISSTLSQTNVGSFVICITYNGRAIRTNFVKVIQPTNDRFFIF